MKETNLEIKKNQVADIEVKKISRKEAIKKTGYIAVSAATMMILLNSPKAQACSPVTDRDDRGTHRDDRGTRRDDRGSQHGGGSGHR